MRASARWCGGSLPKREYLCRHCGRRVFAEHGVLTEVQLCRSCFEKARAQQRSADKVSPKTDKKEE